MFWIFKFKFLFSMLSFAHLDDYYGLQVDYFITMDLCLIVDSLWQNKLNISIFSLHLALW